MEISTDEFKKISGKKMVFTERMGLQIVVFTKGYVKLMAPLAGNENHVGTMYAGALFTLAEVPGGSIFYSLFDGTKYYPIVKDMYIRFRRPATTDITIELRMSEAKAKQIMAEADKNGKADFILEGEMKDAFGEVVAVSKGTYQIRAFAGQ
ncbi:MAG: YiiD C-terminal domain-containing protein [Deltaproteobacteria bacterium]|nr:YiiD C-terminal domain-containing protein [Deltaproteobacteria bacterium]